MKRTAQWTIMGMLTILIAISCRRTNEVITNPPDPQPGNGPSFIQVNISGIAAGQDSLYALLTLKRKSGETIYENGKLPLKEKNGLYSIDSIKVINEEYLINKLIVVRSSDTAAYAVPRPQSEKSAQSNTPLGQIITVPVANTLKVNFQAVKVNAQDNPVSFGYTPEDFGYLSTLDLRLDLSIAVGKTTYDSLPAKVTIDAVNSTGLHWTREVELPAGSLRVTIPKEYDSYKFSIAKWNVFYYIDYRRNQLENGKKLHISFARPAKQLVKEEEWLETQGVLGERSRIEYSYFADKSLNEIKSYEKLASEPALTLGSRARFIYHNDLLDTIFTFTGENISTGYTALTYTGGVLTNLFQKTPASEIGAAVEHNSEGIDFYYLYSNGITSVYRSKYKNGNRISDQSTNSRGTGESASYSYDSNVNPYQQMNLPDLYLTKLSKNNKVAETRQYNGDIPMTVPSKWQYEYDLDGYPTVLWITYKGYSSNQELYRVKKVFTYR